MIYVFDTSAFIVLKNFYPSAFPSLWGRLAKLVQASTIQSVQEVFNELQNYNDADHIQDWAKKNRSVFLKPTPAQQLIVQQIFAVPHFKALVSQKAILKGAAVADPFVVAAAKDRGGTVITQEQFKPNAAKIPNVCSHFNVQYMDLEAFMAQQGWKF